MHACIYRICGARGHTHHELRDFLITWTTDDVIAVHNAFDNSNGRRWRLEITTEDVTLTISHLDNDHEMTFHAREAYDMWAALMSTLGNHPAIGDADTDLEKLRGISYAA